ncbi:MULTISPECIES: hypothetical protein [unclassified Variovorax]|uniref:hypothetical protein n=1 Tax=unclassified Variovorax TaxID=663243 RepID=UPI00076DB0A7|nr:MULTISPECIES: hypothetical protein [unclassified Variovorax]KWT98388.1 hypothetical protein APY03_0523 [Variovorax sp. WDL1]PNG49950.1 hypothetical protein CHC06_05531 [Variovorax sp. B2]PNG50822.1 hypothetical protein CHC07_05436 [Variovorax sp. B4]VTU41848.1 hypothetical protein H6P1_00058 [Variovorax sp. PBL-H6]VTU44486.1 hypothetical protein SRS16P1_00844 [Variovorax sp. SRS16]
MRTATLLLPLCALGASASVFAEATEYAVRWDPDKGGPQSAADAATKLEIDDDKPKKFEVRYLTVKQPPGLPGPGFEVIARERTDKKGPEAMYKLRGPNTPTARQTLPNWQCPLQGTQDAKVEVDVAWVLEDETKPHLPPVIREAISYSCSVAAPASAAYPRSFNMVPKPCSNLVSRLKEDVSKKVAWKVEEWTLPTKSRMVELSYAVDAGSDEHRAAFQKKVDALLKAGAIPLPSSKTTMGGTCPRKARRA